MAEECLKVSYELCLCLTFLSTHLPGTINETCLRVTEKKRINVFPTGSLML